MTKYDNLTKQLRLFWELSRNDFKNKYLGSFLGVTWAFVQPTATIIIFWFVFQVGFKSMPIHDYPFILWFSSAFIVWNFFSDSLQNATNSIIENSYLVKKVVFKVNTLPLLKISSAFFVHLFFIFFLMLMFIFYGHFPDKYTWQIIYYVIATFILVVGLSWLTSSIVIFIKDLGQFIQMILQFGFWLTPIFYTLELVPDKYHFFFKLNPMYYIVEGYRNAFIYKEWFWEHPYETVYFWIITSILLLIGSAVFKRLRPHFADVL